MKEQKNRSKIYKSLVKNETTRMEEFGAHSLNRGKSDTLVEQIKNDYGLYEFENYEPNIEWEMTTNGRYQL